ncbi:MAG: PLP-dependent aspartate aminotransferase family protein [Leptospiraceae bacterium]|nr:PLP-dependent transferase [Leptospiraceae bacterium]MCK6381703.1 PLP-dependent aspartate aminotransferase family protein [Leptospiraceae bacterium]NUM42065.1 PLP-dependent transferase [Leptospiraceae bacterium]
MKPQTSAIHCGVAKDSTFNSVITPIYQTSTFRFEDVGVTKGYDYSRTANPTRRALEENLSALEGGVSARAVTTGMAAITAVLNLFQSGDHILCTDDCYGGTERLFRHFHSTFNLQVTFVNMQDLGLVKKEIRPNTKVVWIETPSNPLLNIVDIQALSDIAHTNNAISVVDNTFLSPVFQKPFELGADLIIHSTTKYLNGHSDVVGGVVISKTEDYAEKIHNIVNNLGLSEAPFDAWLVLRGIKTLFLRMKQHEKNAMDIAKFLEVHPKIKKVNYPGLSSHPQHALAKKQQTGFGSMLSFEVKGTVEEVNKILRSVKIFSVAESLGGIESLICHPATMTHAGMDSAHREKVGITERIIRLSIGIEDVSDLLKDLEEALGKI